MRKSLIYFLNFREFEIAFSNYARNFQFQRKLIDKLFCNAMNFEYNEVILYRNKNWDLLAPKNSIKRQYKDNIKKTAFWKT